LFPPYVDDTCWGEEAFKDLGLEAESEHNGSSQGTPPFLLFIFLAINLISPAVAVQKRRRLSLTKARARRTRDPSLPNTKRVCCLFLFLNHYSYLPNAFLEITPLLLDSKAKELKVLDHRGVI